MKNTVKSELRTHCLVIVRHSQVITDIPDTVDVALIGDESKPIHT